MLAPGGAATLREVPPCCQDEAFCHHLDRESCTGWLEMVLKYLLLTCLHLWMLSSEHECIWLCFASL